MINGTKINYFYKNNNSNYISNFSKFSSAIIAEVFGIDADELLNKILTNPEAEQLLNPIIENRLKEAS